MVRHKSQVKLTKVFNDIIMIFEESKSVESEPNGFLD